MTTYTDPYAKLFKTTQNVMSLLRVTHDGAFGDLYAKVAGIEGGVVENECDASDEVGTVKLRRRQIGGDRNRLEPGLQPARHLMTGLPKDPLTNRTR